MTSSKFIYSLIGIGVLILIFYILRESFSQPGLERFEGKYEELDFYRNENNTGPIVRIYAIKILDMDKELMREFGDSQPHTKYGKTLVFFFSPEVDQEIRLSPTPPYFDESLDEFVLAEYEKTPMGEVRFTNDFDE